MTLPGCHVGVGPVASKPQQRSVSPRQEQIMRAQRGTLQAQAMGTLDHWAHRFLPTLSQASFLYLLRGPLCEGFLGHSSPVSSPGGFFGGRPEFPRKRLQYLSGRDGTRPLHFCLLLQAGEQVLSSGSFHHHGGQALSVTLLMPPCPQ